MNVKRETKVGVVLVPDLICIHGRRSSGSRERSSKSVLVVGYVIVKRQSEANQKDIDVFFVNEGLLYSIMFR